MVFWICILIAVLVAYSAIKMGFYHTWTVLFNLIIAVYLAVRVGPFFEDFFPASVGDDYARALALFITGIVSFLVLHGIASTLLIGQFEVTFPRAVSVFGSGFLGFLAGFLICSFAAFIICTTPICHNQFVKEVGVNDKTFEEAKMQPYLVWWTNFMDQIVGTGDRVPAEKTVKELVTPANTKKALEDANNRSLSLRPIPAEVNEPNKMVNPRQPAEETHTEIPP